MGKGPASPPRSLEQTPKGVAAIRKGRAPERFSCAVHTSAAHGGQDQQETDLLYRVPR